MHLLYCKTCNRLYTDYYSTNSRYTSISVLMISHNTKDKKIREEMDAKAALDGEQLAACAVLNNKDTFLAEIEFEDDNDDDYYSCPMNIESCIDRHPVKRIKIDSSKLTLKELKDIYSLRVMSTYAYFDLNTLTVENVFKLKKLIVEGNVPDWR